MPSFNVEVINLAEVKEYLTRIPEVSFDQAKVEFRQAVVNADTKIKSNFGSKIQSRSGHLRRSLKMTLSGNTLAALKASNWAAATVDSKPIVYTLAQEFGAEIIAKHAYMRVPGGPYLNIPTKANQFPSGLMKFTPKQIRDQGGKIVKGPKGWCIVLKKGKGKNKSLVAMFLLRKSVVIKPALGMVDAVEGEVPTLLSRLKAVIGEQ